MALFVPEDARSVAIDFECVYLTRSLFTGRKQANVFPLSQPALLVVFFVPLLSVRLRRPPTVTMPPFCTAPRLP